MHFVQGLLLEKFEKGEIQKMRKMMTLILISLLITLSSLMAFGATKIAPLATSAKESMKVYGSPPSTVSTVMASKVRLSIPTPPSIANFSSLRDLYPIPADSKILANSVNSLSTKNFGTIPNRVGETRASRPHL